MIALEGLRLGPLGLSWSSLTLVLGLLTWFSLARFPGAERTALLTLLVARLWAALPGLDAGRPLLENVLDVVDIRRGDWAWWPGLIAGALSLAWTHRGRESMGHVPAAVRAALAAVLAGLLPGLLRPADMSAQTWPGTPLPTLTAAGDVTAPSPLPGGRVVNFWATWCGPCRAELPLLEREIARGAPVELVNVGEDPAAVAAFLNRQGLTLSTRVVSEALTAPLRVTAFPTTLVVSESGQIVDRHLGPLNRAQLLRLIQAAQDPPARP